MEPEITDLRWKVLSDNHSALPPWGVAARIDGTHAGIDYAVTALMSRELLDEGDDILTPIMRDLLVDNAIHPNI